MPSQTLWVNKSLLVYEAVERAGWIHEVSLADKYRHIIQTLSVKLHDLNSVATQS
jgi:hypothetical protein